MSLITLSTAIVKGQAQPAARVDSIVVVSRGDTLRLKGAFPRSDSLVKSVFRSAQLATPVEGLSDVHFDVIAVTTILLGEPKISARVVPPDSVHVTIDATQIATGATLTGKVELEYRAHNKRVASGAFVVLQKDAVRTGQKRTHFAPNRGGAREVIATFRYEGQISAVMAKRADERLLEAMVMKTVKPYPIS